MSLVADYSSSSNSSTTDSDDESGADEELTNKTTELNKNDIKPKLPSANQLLTTNASAVKPAGDVFNNRFRVAEDAKIASLEKHVKMVDKLEHIQEKNGRKICWNYRKGRCRFGSKCSYAHDSDVSMEMAAIKATITPDAVLNTTQTTKQRATNNTLETAKRKRPGLSDSVVPSKRVIKSYTNAKQTRP